MKQRKKQARPQFSEHDWNFNSVDDKELVACCYWEYARESDFIRRVVQRMKDVDLGKVTHPLPANGKAAGSSADAELARDNDDLTELYSMPALATLLYRLPFPKPWQKLTKAQKAEGVELLGKAPAWPAFQTTDCYNTASELFRQAKQSYDEQEAAFARLAQLEAGEWSPASEAESNEIRQEIRNQRPLEVRGTGGVDSFIAQINWREFDKKEIVACFKRWLENKGADRQKRAKRIGQRGRGRGNDWRVFLDRLSMMRLLHNYREPEIPEEARGCFNRALDSDVWYKGRRAAGEAFYRLLKRIIPKREQPLSWNTKGGRSR